MEKILFIGDSITEWNPLTHTEIENIGVAGATLEDIIKQLKKAKNSSYKKIFVLAGINDINNNINTTAIIKNYKKLIENIKTLSKDIYIISTLPTKIDFTNNFVKDLNRNLLLIVEEYNAKFINCYDAFVDKSNLLNEEYSIDSIHLSEKGYIMLNSYIVKNLYEKNKLINVKERFLEYVKWHTTSSAKNKNSPSTIGQHFFAYFLKEELEKIGMKEVEVDKYSYVTATLPSNTDKNLDTLAFIAHMDTATDMSGKNVNPQVFENYDGRDLVLNKDTILNQKDFPELKNYIGKELITTDGNTLLGADDKAGIAEIITAMEYLINNPQIKHGRIKVAFTPDEEVGAGCKDLDIEKFGAKYAYTLDGGEIGELEFENFNANNMELYIKGRNVHPGSSKGKMIHAGRIAIEFENMMPVEQKPEYTEKYEGFIMLTSLIAGVEEAKLQYIIRDHDREKFEEKKELINSCVKFLKKKYPLAEFNLKLEDSYYNMKDKIEPCMFLIDIAKKAMKSNNIEPIITPVRGGTDGARLSYMGLPCPNLFTGGHNYHGRYEYVVKESMESAVNVILGIIDNFTKL